MMMDKDLLEDRLDRIEAKLDQVMAMQMDVNRLATELEEKAKPFVDSLANGGLLGAMGGLFGRK
jgi:hypothetical protein